MAEGERGWSRVTCDIGGEGMELSGVVDRGSWSRVA